MAFKNSGKGAEADGSTQSAVPNVEKHKVNRL
jgi:hypothetical protein